MNLPSDKNNSAKIIAYAKLPVERQKLSALKVVSPKDLATMMKDMNKVLARIKVTYMEQANHLAYRTTVVLTEELDTNVKNQKAKSYFPKWKIKLEDKIKKLRSGVSNLKNMKEEKWKNVRIQTSLMRKYWLSTTKNGRSFENHKATNASE